MTPDPFADPPGAEPPDSAVDDWQRPELSDADSRLLEVLSQPDPPVVTAVEDSPPTARAAQDHTPGPPSERRPLDPLFQEPTG